MWRDEALDDLLEAKGIRFEPLDDHAAHAVQKKWLERFASQVKTKTGKFILHSFMWNGFVSKKYEPCLSEGLALEAYRQCEVEPFYLFNEGVQQCFRCTSERLPDFSGCLKDIYIFPESMKWTMVFTHEEGLFGPYFAESAKTLEEQG